MVFSREVRNLRAETKIRKPETAMGWMVLGHEWRWHHEVRHTSRHMGFMGHECIRGDGASSFGAWEFSGAYRVMALLIGDTKVCHFRHHIILRSEFDTPVHSSWFSSSFCIISQIHTFHILNPPTMLGDMSRTDIARPASRSCSTTGYWTR